MNTNTPAKPTWTTLYSLGLIGMAALFFVPSLHVAPMMRTVIMLLIVAALYAAIAMWIQANSTALVREDYDLIKIKVQYDVMRQSKPQTSAPITQTDTDSHDHTEAA